jgi:hypothetical protein
MTGGRYWNAYALPSRRGRLSSQQVTTPQFGLYHSLLTSIQMKTRFRTTSSPFFQPTLTSTTPPSPSSTTNVSAKRLRCILSIILPSKPPNSHSLAWEVQLNNPPISRKRRRVLKNNERISHASSNPPEDVQDQGFTRPSVLILLPFRSSALAWINALTTHTPSFQIENHARFLGEYDLPLDAVDKLVTAPPGTYPADHVEMFKGNVDDSFRMGIKMTRKSVKLFADFYSCDLILASPLGLRMSIEKEK